METTKDKQEERVSTCTPLVATEDLLYYEREFWDVDFVHDVIVKRAKLKPDSTVLLAGCGVGAIARFIHQFVPEGKIVGVDLSEPALEAGKRLNEVVGVNNVTFIQGNILELDELLGGEQFDFVFDDGVLSYFPDRETENRALAQLIKATKPGGIVGSFQIDFSMFFHGILDFEVLEAQKALQLAQIKAGHNHPDPAKTRNLTIAPQIPKMFWDQGLRDVSFAPYLPKEPFPPYPSDLASQLAAGKEKYRKGTPEFEEFVPQLLRGGLTMEEIERYCAIYHRCWMERCEAFKREEFPPLFTQVFLAIFGQKQP